MAEKLRPIRRVVTGNDERGRSRVIFDGPAPNVNPGAVAPGAGMTDLWVLARLEPAWAEVVKQSGARVD